MNNQIQKLAKQAGLEIPANSDYNGHIYQNALAKFANLIIQDCIDTVQRRYMGDNNREDAEVLRCVEDLKQRFG